MKTLQQQPLNQSARTSNESKEEFSQEQMESDMSQGSEYLDDAIRMVDQPLEIHRQNIQD